MILCNKIFADVLSNGGRIYDIMHDKVQDWGDYLILMLPNFIVAVFIFFIFYFLSRFVKGIALKVLHRLFTNYAINKLVAGFLAFIVMMIGIFIILELLHWDKTVTSLLAGAGIIGIALSFAFQDLAANFMSGVLIALKKPFTIGDILESNDYIGTVHQINFRTTNLLTQDGRLVMIPNRKIFANAFVNYTATARKRIDLRLTVRNTEDLKKLKVLCREAIRQIEYVYHEQEAEVFFEEIEKGYLIFVVRFWIQMTALMDYQRAKSDAIEQIKEAFDRNNIELPYPIRMVEITGK